LAAAADPAKKKMQARGQPLVETRRRRFEETWSIPMASERALRQVLRVDEQQRVVASTWVPTGWVDKDPASNSEEMEFVGRKLAASRMQREVLEALRLRKEPVNLGDFREQVSALRRDVNALLDLMAATDLEGLAERLRTDLRQLLREEQAQTVGDLTAQLTQLQEAVAKLRDELQQLPLAPQPVAAEPPPLEEPAVVDISKPVVEIRETERRLREQELRKKAITDRLAQLFPDSATPLSDRVREFIQEQGRTKALTAFQQKFLDDETAWDQWLETLARFVTISARQWYFERLPEDPPDDLRRLFTRSVVENVLKYLYPNFEVKREDRQPDVFLLGVLGIDPEAVSQMSEEVWQRNVSTTVPLRDFQALVKNRSIWLSLDLTRIRPAAEPLAAVTPPPRRLRLRAPAALREASQSIRTFLRGIYEEAEIQRVVDALVDFKPDWKPAQVKAVLAERLFREIGQEFQTLSRDAETQRKRLVDIEEDERKVEEDDFETIQKYETKSQADALQLIRTQKREVEGRLKDVRERRSNAERDLATIQQNRNETALAEDTRKFDQGEQKSVTAFLDNLRSLGDIISKIRVRMDGPRSLIFLGNIMAYWSKARLTYDAVEKIYADGLLPARLFTDFVTRIRVPIENTQRLIDLGLLTGTTDPELELVRSRLSDLRRNLDERIARPLFRS